MTLKTNTLNRIKYEISGGIYTNQIQPRAEGVNLVLAIHTDYKSESFWEMAQLMKKKNLTLTSYLLFYRKSTFDSENSSIFLLIRVLVLPNTLEVFLDSICELVLHEHLCDPADPVV